jgi:tetratricopeptide (TPR) repeat protein
MLLLGLAAASLAQISVEERMAQARRLEDAGSGAEARRLYEALLPDVEPNSAMHAEVLKVLGQLAGRLGDYKAAVSYANKAAEEYHRLKDATGEASAWNNLGVTYLYEGDYPAAGAVLGKAVALSAQAGDHDGHAEHLSNLANVFYFQARYLEALEGYERALALARRFPAAPWAPRRRAVVLINMATLRQRLGARPARRPASCAPTRRRSCSPTSACSTGALAIP